MVRRVAGQFGRLDITVNNAGLGILDADEEIAQEAWDKVIAVNLTGVFLCAQAEVQQMLRQSPTEEKQNTLAWQQPSSDAPSTSGHGHRRADRAFVSLRPPHVPRPNPQSPAPNPCFLTSTHYSAWVRARLR